MIVIFGIFLLMFIVIVFYIAIRLHVLEGKMKMVMNVYEQSMIRRYGPKKPKGTE